MGFYGIAITINYIIMALLVAFDSICQGFSSKCKLMHNVHTNDLQCKIYM